MYSSFLATGEQISSKTIDHQFQRRVNIFIIFRPRLSDQFKDDGPQVSEKSECIHHFWPRPSDQFKDVGPPVSEKSECIHHFWPQPSNQFKDDDEFQRKSECIHHFWPWPSAEFIISEKIGWLLWRMFRWF